MNTGLPPDENITLPEIMRRFPDEKSAIEYFESIRWQHGVVCPHCQSNDQNKFWKLDANKEKKVRVGLRQCAVCKKQFRVTVGTIFEDSHVPLNLWLIAWYLICGAKKGMSAMQLKRHIWGDKKGSYKTAWFIAHRIRHAMQDPVFDKPLRGEIEVDETYVGGKSGRAFKDGVVTTKFSNKTPVVSLVERGGSKRSFVAEHVTAKNMHAAIKEHASRHAWIFTDESRVYTRVKTTHKHYTVNHRAKQYHIRLGGVDAHTNNAESSFSLLKRGIVGSFHHVSKKHLGLYLAEFDHRWNTRKQTDGQRTVAGLKKTEGKRLKL